MTQHSAGTPGVGAVETKGSGVGHKTHDKNGGIYISDHLWSAWFKLYGNPLGGNDVIRRRRRLTKQRSIISFIKEVNLWSDGRRDCYNQLRRLSYSLFRGLNAYDRYRKLLPEYESVNDVADRISREFSFEKAFIVVGPPRSGKTAGGLFGVMRWIVERGVTNYIVIVAVPNHRLGFSLYKSAVGMWINLLNRMKNEVAVNAYVLAKRIKIILYFGGRYSCLRGLEHHGVEDCIKCPLYAEYGRYWRKVPTTPFVDPYMALSAGYCPFRMIYAKGFLRNSIVIVPFTAINLVINAALREGIRKFILFIDEYLEYIASHKARLTRVDTGRFNNNVRDLLMKYNTIISDLERISDDAYADALKKYDSLGVFASNLASNKVKLDSKYNEVIKEKFTELKRLLEASWEKAKDFKANERLRFKRFIRSRLDATVPTLIVYDEKTGEYREIYKLFRVDNGVMMYGLRISRIIEMLREKRCAVGFIGTTIVKPHYVNENLIIVPSRFEYKVIVHSMLNVKRYVRWERLEYITLNDGRNGDSATLRVAKTVLALLGALDYTGVSVEGKTYMFILNKSMLKRVLITVRKLCNCSINVVGDISRGVIDYVVIEGKNRVVLAYARGRLAFGIDLPFNVDTIYLWSGVYRSVNALPFVRIMTKNLKEFMFREIQTWYRSGSRFIKDGDTRTYCYVDYKPKYGYIDLRVYDKLMFLEDSHLALQVLGRMFLNGCLHTVKSRRDYVNAINRYFLLLSPSSSINEDMADAIYSGYIVLNKDNAWFAARDKRDVLRESGLGVDVHAYYVYNMDDINRLIRRLREKKDNDYVLATYIARSLRVEKEVEGLKKRIKRVAGLIGEDGLRRLAKLFRVVGNAVRKAGALGEVFINKHVFDKSLDKYVVKYPVKLVARLIAEYIRQGSVEISVKPVSRGWFDKDVFLAKYATTPY